MNSSSTLAFDTSDLIGGHNTALQPHHLAVQASDLDLAVAHEHCKAVLRDRHVGSILSLCVVGDVLFSGSQDCNIIVWDLGSFTYIGTLPGHHGFVRALAASLPTKLFFSGSQDKTIRVWSLDTFSSTQSLTGHRGEVNALELIDGGGYPVLVSGSEDKSIRLWDIRHLDLCKRPLVIQHRCIENAHMAAVFTLKQLDGGHLLSGSRDKTLRVWRSSAWKGGGEQPLAAKLHPPHYDGVSAVAVRPSDGQFFSASRDGSIRRWTTHSLASDLQQTYAHGDWLQALAVSPSENVLFSGGRDCVIKVWNSDIQALDVLSGHRGPVNALATLDNHLISASSDRTIRFWEVGHYEARQ